MVSSVKMTRFAPPRSWAPCEHDLARVTISRVMTAAPASTTRPTDSPGNSRAASAGAAAAHSVAPVAPATKATVRSVRGRRRSSREQPARKYGTATVGPEETMVPSRPGST